MLTIYITPSCSSCRKARRWLDEHRIQYEEKNIFLQDLKYEDILEMLKCAEHGFDDIISTRSKVIRESNTVLNELTIRDAINFVLTNPSILKRPIIIGNGKIQVGYNEEEIRVFIPRDLRRRIMYERTTQNETEYRELIDRYYRELDDNELD